MRLTDAGDTDLVGSTGNSMRGKLSMRSSSGNVPMLQLEHTSVASTGHIKLTSRADIGNEGSSYIGRNHTLNGGYIEETYIGSHVGYNNQNLNVTYSGFVGIGNWDPKASLDIRKPHEDQMYFSQYTGDHTKGLYMGTNTGGGFSMRSQNQGS